MFARIARQAADAVVFPLDVVADLADLATDGAEALVLHGRRMLSRSTS